MDLLPYSDENESLILLLNSEDSNHSWREKERHEMAETNRIHESFSAEDESSQPLEQDVDSPQDVRRDEQAQKWGSGEERESSHIRFLHNLGARFAEGLGPETAEGSECKIRVLAEATEEEGMT